MGTQYFYVFDDTPMSFLEKILCYCQTMQVPAMCRFQKTQRIIDKWGVLYFTNEAWWLDEWHPIRLQMRNAFGSMHASMAEYERRVHDVNLRFASIRRCDGTTPEDIHDDVVTWADGYTIESYTAIFEAADEFLRLERLALH